KAIADSTLSLTMRALAPGQRVSVFVNEKPVGTLEVETATKRYDVAVPAATLHAGDNRVRLTFKTAATLPGGKRAAAALKLVALGPAALGPPKTDPGIVAVRQVNGRRALVPGGGASRTSFYVQLPAGAELALGFAAPSGAPSATALVRVAVDGQPTRT